MMEAPACRQCHHRDGVPLRPMGGMSAVIAPPPQQSSSPGTPPSPRIRRQAERLAEVLIKQLCGYGASRWGTYRESAAAGKYGKGKRARALSC